MIDARNGGAYAASAAIPYSAGTTYNFRLVVSVSAHTYSVYVQSGSGAEQLLASTFSFRTEQALASTLNNLGLYASVGSETVCKLAVTVANDTTPLLISKVVASTISSSAATITWTTNQASDTQVEYGLTTTYGKVTTLNINRVTLHSQTLNGLDRNTWYHYRVKSRDAAGNLAVSGDFVFKTARR